jgi:hypothetical protein
MCLIVPRITNKLSSKYIKDKISIPDKVFLADPSFRQPQKIDLLMGASHFYELLEARQIKTIPGRPVLQETKFGWVVSGPVHESRCNDIST